MAVEGKSGSSPRAATAESAAEERLERTDDAVYRIELKKIRYKSAGLPPYRYGNPEVRSPPPDGRGRSFVMNRRLVAGRLLRWHLEHR